MKLPKITRKQIYAAAPKSCEVQWPDEMEPKVGNKYSIQTDAGKPTGHKLLVMTVKELAKGWKVSVRLEADPVRLLGKSGGYSESMAGAIGSSDKLNPGNLREEDEAVDPTEIAHYRKSREAQDRYDREHTEAKGELFAAMTELRSAIDAMPSDRKRRMSRTLWTLRSRLDSAEREMRKRRVA